MTSSSALPFRREERLAHGPRGDVWRVLTPDRKVMVAKQAIAPTRGERGQLRDLVRRGRSLQLPLVPFVEFLEAGADVWVLREFDSGVPLAKLALNSPLSHRQAAGTAAACLQALSQLHEAGLCHGRVHGGNVFIEPDGAIRIVDAGIGGPPSRRDQRARRADDMKATAALVYTVWPDWEYEAGRLIYDLLEAGRMGDAAAARQGLELLAGSLPPAENKPSADLALAALGVRLLDADPATVQPAAVPSPRQVEEVPAAAAAIANIWTVAPGKVVASPPSGAPASPPRVAKPPSPPAITTPPSPPPVATSPSSPPAETVASQVSGTRQPVYRWVPGPVKKDTALTAATRVVTEPARRLLSVSGERMGLAASRLPQGLVTSRRTQAAAAVAASVAVVMGIVIGHAVAPAWPPAGRAVGPVAAGGSRAQATVPAPKPETATLHPAAPASAGFVRQVELLPLSDCTTGGHCTIKSVLHFQAPHAAAALTWDLVAVDRCSGAQSVVSSSSSTLDPSWNQVWASDQYSVPSTHPTLLYAVAESPYRVASTPLEINGSGTCTPGA